MTTTYADRRAFLEHQAWPGRSVEVVETHFSCVFLVGDRAYKLKKPVRTPFLDHRSLDARRRDCEAEVALNQPLAPGVYLGTLALTQDDTGGLALAGGGVIVDWLVVMRRLDRTTLLDHRLSRGEPDDAELRSVVDRFSRFYRRATPEPLEPSDYRARLLDGLALDRDELLSDSYPLHSADVEADVEALVRAVTGLAELDERAPRIVDGHGDLRPEHVVIAPEALVIDRLSFDRRVRCVDPLFDLTLLAVECRLLGRTAGDRILDAYRRRVTDPGSDELLALYRSLRATTRARLAIAHLRDGPHDRDRWASRTRNYLALARSELHRWR